MKENNFTSSIKLGLQKLNKLKNNESQGLDGNANVPTQGSFGSNKKLNYSKLKRDTNESPQIVELKKKCSSYDIKILSQAHIHVTNLISEYLIEHVNQDAKEKEELQEKLDWARESTLKGHLPPNFSFKALQKYQDEDTIENWDSGWVRSKTKEPSIKKGAKRINKKIQSVKNVTSFSKLNNVKRKATRESSNNIIKKTKRLNSNCDIVSVNSESYPRIFTQSSLLPANEPVSPNSPGKSHKYSSRTSKLNLKHSCGNLVFSPVKVLKRKSTKQILDPLSLNDAYFDQSEVDQANDEFLAEFENDNEEGNSNQNIQTKIKKAFSVKKKGQYHFRNEFKKTSIKEVFKNKKKNFFQRAKTETGEYGVGFNESSNNGLKSCKSLKSKASKQSALSQKRMQSSVLHHSRTIAVVSNIEENENKIDELFHSSCSRSKLSVLNSLFCKIKENININPCDSRRKLKESITSIQQKSMSLSKEFNNSVDENSSSMAEDAIKAAQNKYRLLLKKEMIYDSNSDEESDDEFADAMYIHPLSPFKITLDAAIIVLVMFCVFYTPIVLALENDIWYDGSYYAQVIIEILIDCVFEIDMVTGFFTAFMHVEEEVYMTKLDQITKHYISGWFTVDFLAGFPCNSLITLFKIRTLFDQELLVLIKLFRLFRLLKALKVAYLNNFVNYIHIYHLDKYNFNSKGFRMLLTLVIFFCSMHFLSCVFLFLGKLTYPNWILRIGLQGADEIDKYTASMYYSMSTVFSVGYGDIISVSIYERIYNIFLLIVGIMMYSFMISSLSNLVLTVNENKKMFNNQMAVLEKIMIKHEKMPTSLYNKIVRFLKYKFSLTNNDMEDVIKDLPIGLRNTLIYEMYRPLIENFIFFKNFDNVDFIIRVVLALKPVLGLKNERLVKEGDYIEEIFFIKNGSLSLEIGVTLINEAEIDYEDQKKYFQRWSMTKKSYMSMHSGVSLSKTKEDQVDVENIPTEENEDLVRSSLGVKIMIIPTKQYVKILEIRKNEHFGDILMFLNKRSPLSVKVRSKVVQMFLLKKPDAVEISMSFPKIWRKIISRSLWNMEQISRLINRAKVLFYTHNKDEYQLRHPRLSVLKGLSTRKTFHFNDTLQEEDIKKLEENKEEYELKSIHSSLIEGNPIPDAEDALDEEKEGVNEINDPNSVTRKTISERADEEEDCEDTVKGVDMNMNEYRQGNEIEEKKDVEISSRPGSRKISRMVIKEVDEEKESEGSELKNKSSSSYESEQTIKMKSENSSMKFSDKKIHQIYTICEDRNDERLSTINPDVGNNVQTTSACKLISNFGHRSRKSNEHSGFKIFVNDRQEPLESEYAIPEEDQNIINGIKRPHSSSVTCIIPQQFTENNVNDFQYETQNTTNNLYPKNKSISENEIQLRVSECKISDRGTSKSKSKSSESINFEDAQSLLKQMGEDPKVFNILYNLNINNKFNIQGKDLESSPNNIIDYKKIKRSLLGKDTARSENIICKHKSLNGDNDIVNCISFMIHSTQKGITNSGVSQQCNNNNEKPRKASCQYPFTKSKSGISSFKKSQSTFEEPHSPKMGEESPIDKRRSSHLKFNLQMDHFLSSRRKLSVPVDNIPNSAMLGKFKYDTEIYGISPRKERKERDTARSNKTNNNLLQVISQNIERNSLNLNDPKFFYQQYFEKVKSIQQANKTLNKKLNGLARLIVSINHKK